MTGRALRGELLLSGDTRPLWRSLAWSVALTLAAIAAVRPFAAPDRFPKDEHAKQSFNLALNLTACGRPAVESTIFAPARYLTEHPDALDLPAPVLIARGAIDTRAYCASLNQPVAHNENTMMLLTSFVWLVNPRASARDVARAVQWMRAVAFAFFAVACLDAGVSVALTFVALCGVFGAQKAMALYEFSLYSLLLVALTTWIAACSLMFVRSRAASLRRVTVLALATGGIAGVLANVRTSYLPIFVVLYAVVVAASVRQRSDATDRPDGWRFATLAAAGFAIGLFAMNALLVTPLVPRADLPATYMHHPLTHNLVLGLAVPPNRVSVAEGIEWRDEVGGELAQRAVPGVVFLGPGYDAALARYYFGLWRSKPRDMAAAYWAKLRRTGRGVFLFASQCVPDWRPWRLIYLVWADRSNGAELIAASIAATSAALWLVWRTASAVAMLAALAGAVLTLILIESAIVYSEFALAYHGFMMFMVLIAPAIAVQAAVDAAAARVRSRSGGGGRRLGADVTL